MSNSVVFKPETTSIQSDNLTNINIIDGVPIKIMERRFFINIIIEVGFIYVDSQTKEIYIGDGITPGGVQSTEYFKMNGIFGGPIKNPRFELNIVGGI